MAQKKYSDAERVTLFRSAFHDMAGRSFWPEMRMNGRVDRIANISFKVDHKTNQVAVSRSPITDKDADLLASHIRKFTSPSDPAHIPDVLESAIRLGATGGVPDEVQSQWSQSSERKFPFLIDNEGRSIGMRIDGLAQTIWWHGVESRPLSGLKTEDVSALDFADVYFNENLFHTYERGRREGIRAIVREVPQALRDNIARMAMGATLYSAVLLHYATAELRAEWACAQECQEMGIIKPQPPPEAAE